MDRSGMVPARYRVLETDPLVCGGHDSYTVAICKTIPKGWVACMHGSPFEPGEFVIWSGGHELYHQTYFNYLRCYNFMIHMLPILEMFISLQIRVIRILAHLPSTCAYECRTPTNSHVYVLQDSMEPRVRRWSTTAPPILAVVRDSARASSGISTACALPSSVEKLCEVKKSAGQKMLRKTKEVVWLGNYSQRDSWTNDIVLVWYCSRVIMFSCDSDLMWYCSHVIFFSCGTNENSAQSRLGSMNKSGVSCDAISPKKITWTPLNIPLFYESFTIASPETLVLRVITFVSNADSMVCAQPGNIPSNTSAMIYRDYYGSSAIYICTAGHSYKDGTRSRTSACSNKTWSPMEGCKGQLTWHLFESTSNIRFTFYLMSLTLISLSLSLSLSLSSSFEWMPITLAWQHWSTFSLY